jgi:single-strand DNA-binding protein
MLTIRNHVQLIGNLGSDPELKEFGEKKKLARISIATNESYVNAKGEKVTETQWHNVIAWGKQAEYLEKYTKKGQQVAISGKLVNSNYEKDGEKRYKTEVVANEVVLLGSRES